jgi:rhodanese-related sulfurtransferase
MKILPALMGIGVLVSAASATPVVVGDGACPTYAVDIEAFATCDQDRVAMPEGVRLDADVLIVEEIVPEGRRTRAALYMDARNAYALKRSHPGEVVLVDIRSGVELSLTGHALPVDLNVPYLEFAQPLSWDRQAAALAMVPNPGFAAELDGELRRRGATRDTVVLLICRTGERSARAADELSTRGYRRVVSIVDGYEGDPGPDGQRSLNGWKNAGLPWTARVNMALLSAGR